MPKAIRGFVLSALALMAWTATAVAAPITLVPFNFTFNTPIGIDFQDTSGQLIMSVNYFNGTPHNLDLVDATTGAPTTFAPTVVGLTNELKIATVRISGCQGGFVAGEVFTGNGTNGQVVRISPDGNTVQNPWVSLGGSAIVRGSLFQDRFCAANGDLIVVTGNEQEGNAANDNVGAVYRVKSDGTATQLTTSIATHLEGVVTLPDIPAVYGPAAGKILAGAEEFQLLGRPNATAADYTSPGGAIYVVDPDGNDVWFTISNGHGSPTPACSLDANGEATPNHCNFHTATEFHPEDLDIIRRNSRFFGVAFSEGHVLTTVDPNTPAPNPPAPDFHQFDSLCGRVLITQELPFAATSGLSSLAWNGTGFDVTPIATTRDGTIVQWEHVTFTSGQDCNTQIEIVKKPDGGTFNIGDQVSFTIVVTNTGNFDATDVKINDPLPTTGGLTWGVTSVTPGPDSDCSIVATQTLSCSFGTLAKDASKTVVVTTTNVGGAPAAACTKLVNTATATSTSAIPDTVTDDGDTTCIPPHLKVVKTPDGGTFSQGGAVSFTIVVSNDAAGSTATNVKLSDQLPTAGGLNWSTATVSTSQGSCSINATSLLTCSFGSINGGASVTVTVSLASTPTAACQSQPNPHAIATADNAAQAEDAGSLSCTPPVNLVTVTQGGWGAPAHGNNPGTVLNAYFAAHPTYKPMIGDITASCSGKTLTFTSANAIRAFLPAGGPPAALSTTATNPTTSSAGVFAGQVLALTLNTQVLSSGPSLLNFVLTSGPATGKTVGTVLADANKALGGCTPLPSYVTSISQLNDIVDSINNMFD